MFFNGSELYVAKLRINYLMGFQVFYSKWVLGLSFDIRILYLIVHDESDSEDLDGYECFAAMEQYRKNFSTLDSNSPFARHLESKVVTFKRLMNFKRPILVEFLQYLDLDDVDGVTRKVLSNLILKAYKNFISVNSSK